MVAELTAEAPQPHAVLDDITVDDKQFPAGPLVVKPGRHRLVFTFTAPSFVVPEQLAFVTGCWDRMAIG